MFSKPLRKKTCILLIVFVGLIVYFNALFNDFFILDDEDQIINNTQIRTIANIPKFFLGSTYYRIESGRSYGFYYRPLMLSFYSLIYAVSGPDPFLFHVVQIGFHIVNSILLYLFLHKFLSNKISFAAALIFTVHPIHSETVLHIANLQDVLFFFFGMIFLLRLTSSNSNKRFWHFFSGAILLLSLFAKETGAIFAVLGLLYLFLFQRRKKLATLTILSTLLLYGFIRFFVARVLLPSSSISRLADMPLYLRIVSVPQIIATYFYTFFFPKYLAISQFWIVETIDISNFFLPLIVVFGFSVFAFFARVRFFKNKSKDKAAYIFFTLWLVLGLLPHIQLVPLSNTFSERWFYLPAAGLLGMLGMLFAKICSKREIVKKYAPVVFFAVIIMLSLRTIIRIFNWRDSKVLLDHDIQISKGNYFLENLYATLLMREDRYDDAKSFVVASVAAYPFFGNLNNMAILYIHDGKLDKALEFFEASIARGAFYTTYQNYANVLLYMAKDYNRARSFAQKSIKLYPNSGLLWLVLAQSEYKLENHDQALAAAYQAYMLEPYDFSLEVYTAIKEGRVIEVEKYLDVEGL